MAKPQQRPSVPHSPPASKKHDHASHAGRGRTRCLKILKALSAYIDEELPPAVCDEIRRHMGTCPNCEEFVQSLRQTVNICRHYEPRSLSPALRSRIRRSVLEAVSNP